MPFDKIAKRVLIDVFRGNTEVKIQPGNKDSMDKNGVYGHLTVIAAKPYILNGMPEHLIEIMHAAGYYLAYKTAMVLPHDSAYFWQFEPYYYDEVRETLEENIFHVTQVSLLPNILCDGLVASGQDPESAFVYPPCNYFFNGPFRNNFLAYGRTSNKFDDEKEFAACKISTVGLPEDIEFFTDSNYMGKNAVYTYQNIPPEFIINTVIENLI